jgi:hypothetical protein
VARRIYDAHHAPGFRCGGDEIALPLSGRLKDANQESYKPHVRT